MHFVYLRGLTPFAALVYLRGLVLFRIVNLTR